MKYYSNNLLFLPLIGLLISCSSEPSSRAPKGLNIDITPADIRTHISFLAADSLKGRETGTAGEARAANYIADRFREFGLKPAGDSARYFQEFIVNMSVLNNPHQKGPSSNSGEKRIARNVIGLIEGTKQADPYIIIGAHYDHLGMGSFGSLNNDSREAIHNGADDNASGVSGLLELAQYFSQHPPSNNILLVAFSGEELGLLGSQYFVDHPTISLEQAVAMINLDMIGRMQDGKLLIFGTGSSPVWPALIKQANTDSLSIDMVPDGTGASDHTSFYNRDIPVIHYFTDTHADYHRPSDDTEFINFKGQAQILNHLRGVVSAIDTLSGEQLTFTETPTTQRPNITLGGVTLGVTPDYGFEGKGMRITGIRSGGPAAKTGLQSGDVIIRLDDRQLSDIYDYMDVLNKLEKGDSSTVTVRREGKEMTFKLTL